jgi:hypothetical protein
MNQGIIGLLIFLFIEQWVLDNFGTDRLCY